MNLEPSRASGPEDRDWNAPVSPRVAALEQLAALAASALRVPLLIVAVPGTDDERSCVLLGGADALRWSAADEAALWRSGLVELGSTGTVELRDMTRTYPVDQLRAFAQLRVGSALVSPIRSAAGDVRGVICAAYAAPTVWNDDDREMLQQFARLAAADLDLRRRVQLLEVREERRDYLATHDALTGLATRAALVERLRAALERPPTPTPNLREVSDEVLAPAPENLVAVFLIDVANFPVVNTLFGHEVGEQVLVTLAHRLRRAAGREALVARLGDDRFGALVERLRTAASADQLAARLRDAVEEPLTIGGELVMLAARVGVSLSATTSTLAEHLMRRADLAVSTETVAAQAASQPRMARGPVPRAAKEPETRPTPPRVVALPQMPPIPQHDPAPNGGSLLRRRSRGGPFVWIARRWRSMTSLLRNASEYAQVASGDVRLRIETVSIATLLEELRRDAVRRTYELGLHYHASPCPPDLQARVDPKKVRCVLRHLLSNAMKFTEAGGEIFVECEANEQALRIRVRDTGRGIPPAWLTEVFEPYVQVDAHHMPRDQRGLGLGLTISQLLATAMGGALAAESELGRGSSFTLTLLRG